MYPGHPWEGEDYGRVEHEWYLARKYELAVMFKVNLRPFLKFCKDFGHRSQELTMKIAARLSTLHLPQFMLGLNGKIYAARYPAGYVRPVREGTDMLEHIAIREEPTKFAERDIRAGWKPLVKWMAQKHPRLSVFMAKRFFGYRETKNNYALMVSRNALRGLGPGTIYMGSHFRTMCLGIPFGEQALCSFVAPHALGNMNFFEPFLVKFKTFMEDPEQISPDLLDKPYAGI